MASHRNSIMFCTGSGPSNKHVAGGDDDAYGYARCFYLQNLRQGQPNCTWQYHWAREAGSGLFGKISHDQLNPEFVTGRPGRGDYFHSLAVASSEAC